MHESDMQNPQLRSSIEALGRCTENVQQDPYNLAIRYERATVFSNLGYPDLAAAEAYKALLLVDEASDESGEYHEQAREWPDQQSGSFADVCKEWRCSALVMLARSFLILGCLRTAYGFAGRLTREDPAAGSEAEQKIRFVAKKREQKRSLYFLDDTSSAESFVLADDPSVHTDPTENGHETSFNSKSLPDAGYVPREIYPWNWHEADRTTEHALEVLNEQLLAVAPKLEVRVTDLPVLSRDPSSGIETPTRKERTKRQLGIFAKQGFAPGEDVLRERSLLTANARLHEPLCDACSEQLPPIAMGAGYTNGESSTDTTPVPCADCDDIVYCSQECHDLAQSSYHPAVCGMDVETLSKDVPRAKAADALYTLLLYRALAMSQTQGTHLLDLAEVKYIWGDFEATPRVVDLGEGLIGDKLFKSRARTLPFSFEDNIMAPLHMLEKMDIDIFASPNDIAELWVWNVLYAKFRGTASARISPRDGRPEVAAVHPMWCLANHSCDPNVRWEWAGEIQFTARRKRKEWQRKSIGEHETKEPADAGIKAGEEIWNHYVDIDLPVNARREWGVGALGGSCQCDRCMWEACETA